MIPISNIKYEGSLRDLDDQTIEGLKASIQTDGLLHPLTVRAIRGNETEVMLIAGKKRLRAAKELGMTEVPVLKLAEDLTIDQCFEIGLRENLRRYNIPWYEQIEEERKLHQLRLKQHGQRRGTGAHRAEKGWSLRDTAKELEIPLANLHQDLKLAEILKKNPHLRNVKDKTTAIKLSKQIIARETAEMDSLIPSEFELNQVLLGDSSEILKGIPDGTFDACITDPPWLDFKDPNLTRDDKTVGIFKEVYRVLKPTGFLYMVVSTGDFFDYSRILPGYGFRVQTYPLLWTKSGTISHGKRSWEYARDYEPILLAVKGNPTLTIPTELSAVFQYPALHSSRLTHPNEKPIELIKKIIGHCTWDGGKILDPFAGSGVVGQACKEMGRPYLLIERELKYFNNIEKRLKNGQSEENH